MNVKSVGLVIICIGLVGCVSSGTQRGLIGAQVFYSDGVPKMQVTVTEKPDNVFHYKVRKTGNFSNGRSYIKDVEQYVFLNLDGNKIKSGVVIEYNKLSSGHYLPNVYSDRIKPFDSRREVFDGKTFQYILGCLPVDLPFNQPIIEKIEKTDISLPNHFLVYAIGRRVGNDKRVRIYVSYIENLNYSDESEYSYSDWKDKTLLTDDQKQILKDLKKRAEKSFVLSHKLDSSESAVVIQNDYLKSKLSLLKESYDAGLITKDDYETKKKELLDDL